MKQVKETTAQFYATAIGNAVALMDAAVKEGRAGNLSIQQMASDMFMSYSNFRRRFRQYMGVAPSAYLLQARMEQAKVLLATTKMQVKEIAAFLGFYTGDYFTAQFTAKVGMTPMKFRKQLHKNPCF